MTWDNAMDPNAKPMKMPKAKVSKAAKFKNSIYKTLGSDTSKHSIDSKYICWVRVTFIAYIILISILILNGVLNK